LPKDGFTSRWGFVLAAMGAAVGTGNIWRFPRETAMYGGGAFIVAWLIALFLWSIPLLMAEFAIGRHTRMGTMGSFKKFAGKKYTWMGTWMVWVSAAINFYYAIVMGWTIRYFLFAFSGQLTPDMDTGAMWHAFTSSPAQVVLFQLIAVVCGGFVVYRGIAKGVEKANQILLPTLIGLLIVAAIWSLTLPKAIDGLRYMFIPQMEWFGKPEMWIHALSQSAWSCSAGMGMAITYAVYTRKREDVGLNSLLTGLGNNSVSIIAGVAVMCTLFGLSPSIAAAYQGIESGSNGLTFIYLTRLFAQMPFGFVMAGLFFLAMSFAALTSLISGYEIATRNFMDHGWTRKQSVMVVLAASFALGLPSAFSMHFFENQDNVWGLGLLLSGLFVSFAVIKFGASEFRMKFLNTEDSNLYIGVWWEIIIKYVMPVELTVCLVWFLWETLRDAPGTFATLVFQWSAVLAAIIYFNRWFSKRILDKSPDTEEEVVVLEKGEAAEGD